MNILKKILALFLAAALGVGIVDIQVSQRASADTASEVTTAQTNEELSREAATQGMVLLQNNEQSLPLEAGESVALFGEGQINFIKGGGGSGDVNVDHVVNLLEGMQTKQSEGKITLNQTLADKYLANSSYTPTVTEINAAAKQSDTAVLVISRSSGEGSDRTATAGDYYLSSGEISLLNKVCAAGFGNIVVVLNIGGVMDTSWIQDYPAVKSVLLAWQPGMEGGLAAADVLVGDVNPSGKLTDTFAKSYDDYPSSETFAEAWDHVDYTEDIYVGYRYFETFDPQYEKVNYEFGYGLSYTTFSITDVNTAVSDTTVTVTAKVTNTGNVAGKEVVQVYFSAPQGLLGKPAKELAGFDKTDLLNPGESQTLTITYDITDMSSYDDTGKVQESAYVMEAGDYNIYVGNSVKDAGQNGIRYTYTLPQTVVTDQLTEECEPTMLAERLLADGSYESLETYETMDDIGQTVSADGVTKIEAESLYYKHAHSAVNYSDDYSVCGLETYTSEQGNRWASYILDVEEAGDYALSLGIGNGGSKLTNSIKVYVDDVEVSGATLNFPSTGGKWKIEEVGSTTVSLLAGKCILKIEFTNGDDFQGVMDYFTLKKGEGTIEEPDTVHAVSASGVNQIEGEAYADGDGKVKTETITAGTNSGGICLAGLDQSGTWSSYTLNVAEAGTYSLSFHAANGYGTDHNDSVAVLVNGEEQSGITVNLPNTATAENQWYVFTDTDPVTVTLPAGTVTLRFDYNSFGNLDYFTLEKTALQSDVVASLSVASSSDDSSGTLMLKDVYEDDSLMSAFLAQLTTEQLADLAHGHGASIADGTGSIGGLSEYGIPLAETADGPAGLRLAHSTTAWPIATLLACTWDTELMEQIGVAAGTEAKEAGVDVWLAPGMNIHRNPLCGRNFEYYSEDPLVTGKMAAALTTGVQYQKVAVTIKHFAANNKEAYRGYSDSRMSERALREIYLKGFEICVKEADPWCIMSSYNHINGIKTDESYGLLTTILRDEWGYDGMVMTDWWNDSIASHEVAAGNDLKMQSGDTANVLGAIANGTLTRAELERNVARILQMIMKTNAMTRSVLDPETATVSASATTRIKAIDYTWKYLDIGIEECEDSDGGYNPTDTYEGRWLSYAVNVEKGGLYKLRARVASPNGTGQIAFSADGIALGTLSNTVSTGGWQSWTTTGDITVKLAAGMNEIKLSFEQGGFNVNWFELERVESAAEVTISAPVSTIAKGQSLALSAAVTGGRDAIDWSVEGQNATGTSMDSDGVLCIAADETADFVIVTAAYRFDSNALDAVKINIGEAEPVILGDVDNDGNVTVSDVVELRGVIMAGAPTDHELSTGDLDENGSLTVSDVVELRDYIMSGVTRDTTLP